MIPVLYSPTTTSFTTGGLGKLVDAGSCMVTEEKNGSYELELTYPITGHLYDQIQQRSIIFAKPSPAQSAQPFRVYRITKPLNKVVTVYAAHISYDLSGIPIKNFTSESLQGALTALTTYSVVSNPFTFWSDKMDSGTMEIDVPMPCRTVLSNILDAYGGEYEFDKYTVKLHSTRGFDNGVTIKYGKNLTDLEQDENCSNVYTGVLPYWTGDETTITGSVVNAPGTYNFTRILPVDFSSDFEEQPTTSQLSTAATNYISANNIGIPEVSLTVSFVHLDQTEEYKNLGVFERVELGDTIKVEFAAMGVSASARCVKTVYDTLLERYDNVELGETKKGLADTISSQSSSIIDISKNTGISSAVKAAIIAATEAITGQQGGSVILHDTRGGNKPNELLFLDNDDISQAQQVWRFNLAGLGYSSNGYNGPFTTAITRDGSIVADFITTGSMNAARVTAGILKSQNGRVQFDLTAGTLTIKDGSGKTKLGFDSSGNLTITGTVYASSGEFNGKITATSGTIGGFTINSNSLSGDSCTLYPDEGGGVLKLGDVKLSGYGGLGIDSNVGIDYGLTVGNGIYVNSGNIEAEGNVYGENIDASGTFFGNLPASTGGEAVYWGSSTRRFVYHSSSRKYKKNIKGITTNEAQKLLELNPVTFVYKNDETEALQYGLIAEETHELYPAMIGMRKGEIESVHYEQLWAPVIKMIQIQENRIAALEDEISELKQSLNSLAARFDN